MARIVRDVRYGLRIRRVICVLLFLLFTTSSFVKPYNRIQREKCAILIISDDARRTQYDDHYKSVACYAEAHGYKFITSNVLPECKHVFHFFFQRHCTASLIMERSNYDLFIILDGDNHVVNFDRPIFSVLGSTYAEIYLQERLFNNEIASYAFAVRNTEEGRMFLKTWTQLDEVVQGVEHDVLHNYDNGMLHLAILKYYGLTDNNPGYQRCLQHYYEGSYGTYVFYDTFVGCCRDLIRKEQNGARKPGKLVILPKGQGFTRDVGDCTEWGEADLFIHGEKGMPRHFLRGFGESCALDSVIDITRKSTVNHVKDSLEYAELAGRQERKPAYIGQQAWNKCYPLCTPHDEYGNDQFFGHNAFLRKAQKLPNSADWKCYWKRYVGLWTHLREWDLEARIHVAENFYAESVQGRNPFCEDFADVVTPEPIEVYQIPSIPTSLDRFERRSLVRVSESEIASIPLNESADFMIPRLIHRSGPTPLSKENEDNIKSWQRHHPLPWEHVYWTDEKTDIFVRENVPWFLPCWAKLQFSIMRFDASRAIWLYVLGGLYVDMDVDTGLNNDVLLRGAKAVFMEDNFQKHNNPWPGPHVDNWYMASIPRHPVFRDYLLYICKNVETVKVDITGAKSTFKSYSSSPAAEGADPKAGATLLLTGPHALGAVLLNHIEKHPESTQQIRVLRRFGRDAAVKEDVSGEGPIAAKDEYMVHRMRGSWVGFEKEQ